MDLDKVAEKVSKRLESYEKKSHSEKTYGDGAHKYMQWHNPHKLP